MQQIVEEMNEMKPQISYTFFWGGGHLKSVTISINADINYKRIPVKATVGYKSMQMNTLTSNYTA